jgi:hypothetical protein
MKTALGAGPGRISAQDGSRGVKFLIVPGFAGTANAHIRNPTVPQ